MWRWGPSQCGLDNDVPMGATKLKITLDTWSTPVKSRIKSQEPKNHLFNSEKCALVSSLHQLKVENCHIATWFPWFRVLLWHRMPLPFASLSPMVCAARSPLMARITAGRLGRTILGVKELHKSYPSSHNHGSGKWPYCKGNKSWGNPFPTSMIMGGRVTSMHMEPEKETKWAEGRNCTDHHASGNTKGSGWCFGSSCGLHIWLLLILWGSRCLSKQESCEETPEILDSLTHSLKQKKFRWQWKMLSVLIYSSKSAMSRFTVFRNFSWHFIMLTFL